MKRWLKTVLIVMGVFLLFFVLVILFISPITKYLIERYDEKYSGRKIEVGWVYVNPFSGYIHLNELKIYEFQSDSIFFSADGVNANLGIWKLLSGTYEISEIALKKPRGMIIQRNQVLNFNDLIVLFTPKKSAQPRKKPVQFSLKNINIRDGEFHYIEDRIPINYFIKNVNIESDVIQWNIDSIIVRAAFASGIGNGDVDGSISINTKNSDFRIAVVVQKFDLDIVGQYLKDLTNYGNFSANLDADMKINGNFGDQEKISSSGEVLVNDFHFGKSKLEDYASFDKLHVEIIEMNTIKKKFLFDSLTLHRPYFKYERYDYLDNIQTMFGKQGSNIRAVNADSSKFNLVIEIAKYVEVLAKKFMESYYQINCVAIYKGDLKFNDYRLSEKFSADLNPLNITADSIDRNNSSIDVFLYSGIRPYGKVNASLDLSLKNHGDFHLKYQIQKLPISMFNPYVITYTSFPLDRGTLDFHGSWNVREGIVNSNNHLVILDPRVTRRIRNKDTKWIPVPLIFAFIRERGNLIDYEIPISGNMKDPEFHYRDVILDLLENIFVKPATTAYRMQVKNAESEIEKSFSLNWRMRHTAFLPGDEKFIEEMVDFLVDNPQAVIDVTPKLYLVKEKEHILFYEAKKKYFLTVNRKNSGEFSEEDDITVNRMSVKDSLFVRFIDNLIRDSLLFTMEDKCSRVIRPGLVNEQLEILRKTRESSFLAYFKERNVDKQVKMQPEEHVIPFNGLSFYLLHYKGNFPDPLIKAYQVMNELNSTKPGKKIRKQRNESKVSKKKKD